MKKVRIGYKPNRRPVSLTPTMRRESHMHVIGASGTGKSKFLEQLAREDIKAGHGLCLLDWHGPLYRNVLQWCAYHRIGLKPDYRKLILIDLTQTAWTKPLNFFVKSSDDIASQVNRRLAAICKVWGDDIDELPRFQRVARQILTFSIEHDEPLPNASHLLDFKRAELRQFAAATTKSGWIQRQWETLSQTSKNPREWNETTESTINRFGRFLEGVTVKRTLGLTNDTLDLRAEMDQNSIILVNLGASDYLDREQAKLFAALFLNQFAESAMERASALKAGEMAPFFGLYLDEFQEYASDGDDLSRMLDGVRKAGVSAVLAHQHLGHFAENPRLEQSVFTNARIRLVFGGCSFDDGAKLANEMFLHDLNQRQVQKAIYHTVHTYEEQTRTVHSSGSSTSHGAGQGRSQSWQSGTGLGSVVASGQSAGLISPAVEGWSDDPTPTTTESSLRSEASSQFSTENLGSNKTERRFQLKYRKRQRNRGTGLGTDSQAGARIRKHLEPRGETLESGATAERADATPLFYKTHQRTNPAHAGPVPARSIDSS